MLLFGHCRAGPFVPRSSPGTDQQHEGGRRDPFVVIDAKAYQSWLVFMDIEVNPARWIPGPPAAAQEEVAVVSAPNDGLHVHACRQP